MVTMTTPENGTVSEQEMERAAGSAGPEAVRALRVLLEGNDRFRRARPEHPGQDPARRQEVLSGQHPSAMVLYCSDSRVPVETVFDTGIGDLFGMRVAGNLLDSAVLGSIEYAAEHLGVRLLVVLGHSSCGAVAATAEVIRSGQTPGGHIGWLAETLRPAIAEALASLPASETSLRTAEEANVRYVIEQTLSRSEIVQEFVEAGRLAIVGAYYDMADGAVTLLD
jgi:carbonic anhydrase